MKKNHLSSMTAATMAFLLAASAPFQAFAEEANPDSSYSVDQERLTDNQLDYDEIGARVKEYYGPIKSAYNMVRGMTEDQGRSQLMRGPCRRSYFPGKSSRRPCQRPDRYGSDDQQGNGKSAA